MWGLLCFLIPHKWRIDPYRSIAVTVIGPPDVEQAICARCGYKSIRKMKPKNYI